MNGSAILFVDDDKLEYAPKAVKKVLLKADALKMLSLIRNEIDKLEEITPESIEMMLRLLAEKHNVGLGKAAQPLRVAITATNVSPPIFDTVDLLGKNSTLARIDHTIKRFNNAENL